jgi:predicted transcriptional regulator
MVTDNPEQNHKQFLGHMRRLSKAGLTYAQIAAALGVSERSIYKWVAKDRKVGPLLLLALERVVDERGA